MRKMSLASYCLMCFVTLCIGLQFGACEHVTMRVSLNRREDGVAAASLYIGNATGKLLRNLSLLLDIDALMDDSNKLIGARGFVKETKTKDAVAFSCTDITKEEVTRRLLLNVCPEKGEDMLSIVSRAGWGTDKKVVRPNRTQAADFLIVDGLTYHISSTDYVTYLRHQETYQMKHLGDLICNFMISDDGKLFEGIGWDHFNYINNGGLGPRSLFVTFVKKERDGSPSAAAMKVFRELVKTAICTNKLSPQYYIIPYHLIHDFGAIGSESFEKNGMRKWDGCKDNLDFLFQTESSENRTLSIIPRFEWSGTNPKDDLLNISSPIKYLIVRNFSPRCFLNCKNFLKVLEKSMIIQNGNMRSNFIVAEDGMAYEAEGWGKALDKHSQKIKAATVAFLGSFYSYRPNERIFMALKTLIEEGLRSGKLSPKYRIVSMKAVYQGSPSIGNMLEDAIHKLDRYLDI